MEKILVNVDWSRNYSASLANEDVAVVVTGKTLDEVKERMEFSLREHIAEMRADGDFIPEEFAGKYELDYHLTIRALLHHTDGIVPRKALARVTGINLQQLSHYASGWRNPRPDMERRIVQGLHEIGQQLMSISL